LHSFLINNKLPVFGNQTRCSPIHDLLEFISTFGSSTGRRSWCKFVNANISSYNWSFLSWRRERCKQALFQRINLSLSDLFLNICKGHLTTRGPAIRLGGAPIFGFI
jgi:hypothetical protein